MSSVFFPPCPPCENLGSSPFPLLPPLPNPCINLRQLLVAHDAFRPELHEEDEHEGEDYPLEYLQGAQGFQEERKEDRREDGARERTHAAEVDHDHAFGGFHDLEGGGVDDCFAVL